MPVRRTPHLGPWKLVAPNGIQLNDQDWNTGSVWTVCPLSGERLLLGTEQGGLWLSEPDATGAYQTRCLSNDWDNWGFPACVQDPADSNRIFFGSSPGLGGTAGVYIGNFGVQPDSWTFVPLPPSISAASGAFGANSALPSGVIAMIILPLQRLLVVATGVGIGWMQIDNKPFTWYSDQQWISDLANLPGDDFLFVSTVATPLATSPPISTLNKGSIGGGTTFTSVPIPSSAIHWTKRPGRTKHAPFVTPLRIASCRGHRENLYCLGRVQRADTPQLFIIRSQDAGATWQECAYATNLASENLAEVLEFSDAGPKSPFSIAVHPINPEIVASGFGGAALSTDGGTRWTSLTSLQGWHPDVHELLFHLEPLPKSKPGGPRKARRYSLYIPSDGGILRWTGSDSNASFATSPLVADSSRNRSLPIVMLYSPDNKRGAMFGNLSMAAGVIAAGSQDNANLWLDLENPIWRLVYHGGDGGATALSNQGILPFVLHSQSFNKIPVRMARRANPSSWGLSTTVPIRLNATTLDATGILPAFLRPVMPEIGLVSGPERSPVIALASPAKSNVVYAAVIATVLDPAGAIVSQQVEWNIFGQLQAGETVSCLEAHNSSSVLVGTETGRIFLLKEQASPSEASFKQKPSHPIRGIASNGTTIACFETNDSAFVSIFGTPASFLYVGQFRQQSLPGKGKIAKNLVRVDTSAFPRNDGYSTFHSICANRSQKNVYLSFALTVDENEVWVCLSSDLSHWRRQVTGLPRAIRCSDVVFSESVRGGELLLSSYGRAVWRLIF